MVIGVFQAGTLGAAYVNNRSVPTARVHTEHRTSILCMVSPEFECAHYYLVYTHRSGENPANFCC